MCLSLNLFYLLSQIAEVAQNLRNERKQGKINFEREKLSGDTENNFMHPIQRQIKESRKSFLNLLRVGLIISSI